MLETTDRQGKRMNYQDYLKSPDWKEKKRQKKLRPNVWCAICGSQDLIDVHHLTYRKLYDVEQSDLRLLCRCCHFLAHDLMKQGKLEFTPGMSHHAKFRLTKVKVKTALGTSQVSMFSEAYKDYVKRQGKLFP